MGGVPNPRKAAVFDKYQVHKEGTQYEKCCAWRTAVGLQAVDGLSVSRYLEETACRHIEGDISIDEANELINEYYAVLGEADEDAARVQEADTVAARIAAILSEKATSFTPVTLRKIHERLFDGLYDHAGMWRRCVITKREWVLGGESVSYTHPFMIEDTLDYDFKQERDFSYRGLPLQEIIRHVAKFISGIWQIHPFREGNTRTTAVFCIQYLRKLGLEIDNEPFAANSWYFRNALVRANYSDVKNGIFETREFLDMFFDNLLLHGNHVLSNRSMLVKPDIPNRHDGGLALSADEKSLLAYLGANPVMRQSELASAMGKSGRTIQRMTVALQKKGLLTRENGRRNGRWVVKMV